MNLFSAPTTTTTTARTTTASLFFFVGKTQWHLSSTDYNRKQKYLKQWEVNGDNHNIRRSGPKCPLPSEVPSSEYPPSFQRDGDFVHFTYRGLWKWTFLNVRMWFHTFSSLNLTRKFAKWRTGFLACHAYFLVNLYDSVFVFRRRYDQMSKLNNWSKTILYCVETNRNF